MKHKFGQTLFSDAADDSLGVHLAESEEEDRSAFLVIVVPAPGEIVLNNWRLLECEILQS